MSFKITHIIYAVLLLLMVFFLGSCHRDLESFSDVPEIELLDVKTVKDSSGKDSILQITFSYQDGDGDIGFLDSDTFAPYNAGSIYQYNLWWEILEFKDPQWVHVLDATRTSPENFSLRTPDLRPTGKIKQINGEMSIKANAYPSKLYPDSVICRLTLIDRSLNHSNTIVTEVIQLTH